MSATVHAALQEIEQSQIEGAVRSAGVLAPVLFVLIFSVSATALFGTLNRVITSRKLSRLLKIHFPVPAGILILAIVFSFIIRPRPYHRK